MAIASLICGIVGPCLGWFPCLIGLILGIVSLVKISGSGGRLHGRGLAIAGTAISAFWAVLLPLMAALLYPTIVGALDQANGAASRNNVVQLGIAAMNYAADHKQQLPPAETWPEELKKEDGITDDILKDPGNRAAGRAYAMNTFMGGKIAYVPHPTRTVLFFECKFGSPPAGGPELLPEKPRHANKYIIGFCDGHAEHVPPEELGGLIWNPKAESAGY